MMLEEAITVLNQAGLTASDTRAYCTLQVFEDLGNNEAEWGCFIHQREDKWLLEAHPIMTPGPGAVIYVDTLDEVIDLTIYLYAHRRELEGLSDVDAIIKTYQLSNQWRTLS